MSVCVCVRERERERERERRMWDELYTCGCYYNAVIVRLKHQHCESKHFHFLYCPSRILVVVVDISPSSDATDWS